MGSLTRKIRKNANKFNRILKIIEDKFQSDGNEQIGMPFDLSKVVETDVEKQEEVVRKERNKKKAKRRAQKDK